MDSDSVPISGDINEASKTEDLDQGNNEMSSVEGSYVSLLADIATIERNEENQQNNQLQAECTNASEPEQILYPHTEFTGEDELQDISVANIPSSLSNDDLISYQNLSYNLTNNGSATGSVQQYVIIQQPVQALYNHHTANVSDALISNRAIQTPRTNLQMTVDTNKEFEAAIANIEGVETDTLSHTSLLVSTNKQGYVAGVQFVADETLPVIQQKGPTKRKSVKKLQNSLLFTDRFTSSTNSLKKFTPQELNSEKTESEIFAEYFENSRLKVAQKDSKKVEQVDNSSNNRINVDDIGGDAESKTQACLTSLHNKTKPDSAAAATKDEIGAEGALNETVSSAQKLPTNVSGKGDNRTMKRKHYSVSFSVDKSVSKKSKLNIENVQQRSSSRLAEKLKRNMNGDKQINTEKLNEYETVTTSLVDMHDRNLSAVNKGFREVTRDEFKESCAQSCAHRSETVVGKTCSEMVEMVELPDKYVLSISTLKKSLDRNVEINIYVNDIVEVSSLERASSKNGLRYKLVVSKKEVIEPTEMIKAETELKNDELCNDLKLFKKNTKKTKSGDCLTKSSLKDRDNMKLDNTSDIDKFSVETHIDIKPVTTTYSRDVKNVQQNKAISILKPRINTDSIEELVDNVMTDHAHTNTDEIEAVDDQQDTEFDETTNVENSSNKKTDSDKLSKQCDMTYLSEEVNAINSKHREVTKKSSAQKKVKKPKCYTVRLDDEGKRYFDCKKCSYSSQYSQNVIVHGLTHGSAKDAVCDECGLAFFNFTILRKHKLVHQTLRPISCPLCEQKFKSNVNLKQHLQRHLGVKNYICEHCSRGFVTKGDLNKHSRTHTGAVPYKCNMCAKKFADISSMYRHLSSIHHVQGRYRCKLCSQTFTKLTAITSHLKKQHELVTVDSDGKTQTDSWIEDLTSPVSAVTNMIPLDSSQPMLTFQTLADFQPEMKTDRYEDLKETTVIVSSIL